MSAPVVSLSPSCHLVGKHTYARRSSEAVCAFLGIPYAAPPVGKLRFQRPEPLTALWQGDRDATKFGPICPQSNNKAVRRVYYPFPFPEDEMSEDCLYLNVWTPTTDDSRKLPVMVYIYGGSFLHGFSNYYDGTAMAARQNVVYVSLNYRVGGFGFLATEDGRIPGNMGLLDQVAALKWVQKHIHNFGGDPDNVTLFGESAGGISTNMHMVSPLSRGLFRRAISQSGVSAYPSSVWPRRNAARYLSGRIKRAGSKAHSTEDIMAFLDSKSSRELVDIFGDGFNPILDGYFLPDDPLNLYRSGRFHDIDFMLGYNSHEGAFFVFPLAGSTSVTSRVKAKALIETVIKKMFFRGHPRGDAVCRAVYDEYIGAAGRMLTAAEITRGLVDMYGDLLFAVPTIHIANMHSGQSRTFLYKYSHRSITSRHPDWVRADHGNEVSYVTGEPFLDRFPEWPDEEKAVSHLLMTYWANFARTGDPNGSSVPSWPRYDPDKQQYLEITGDKASLEGGVTKRSRPKPDKLEFWTKTISHILHGGTQSKY